MNKFQSWFSGLGTLLQIIIISVSLVLVLGAVGSIAQAGKTSQPVVKEETNNVDEEVQPSVTFRTEEKIKKIPFKTLNVEDDDLDKGTSQIRVKGIKGIRVKTYHVTYTDDVETNRVKFSDEITREPEDEVIAIGTYVKPKVVQSSCDSNYSGCVPNVDYDLDCPDIGFSVNVIGYDKHGFDREGDGIGCESY